MAATVPSGFFEKLGCKSKTQLKYEIYGLVGLEIPQGLSEITVVSNV
jgi:hypothetical protein